MSGTTSHTAHTLNHMHAIAAAASYTQGGRLMQQKERAETKRQRDLMHFLQHTTEHACLKPGSTQGEQQLA